MKSPYHCIYLSVLIKPVPGVGVSDVRVGLKHFLVNHPFDGDLQVNLDQGSWHRVGSQLELNGRQVALGSSGVVDLRMKMKVENLNYCKLHSSVMGLFCLVMKHSPGVT